MFTDLNVFKTAYAMATHAGQRQSVIARNMANADTPGYQARDIQAFEKVFEQSSSGVEMRASRALHLNGQDSDNYTWPETLANGPEELNGNNVSIEEEMLKAVDIKRQHDRALAIYRSSLNVLRISLGKS